MVQDLNDIFYYAQVVEHRGFAAAGRAIHMPRSKLSRRILLLEERLGVLLIQRSTRQFSVTEIGQEYYRHCLAVLLEADAAQEVIDQTRSEPRGLIRVSCPVGMLQFWAGDMLARFMAKNSRVGIYLEATNRRVDVIAEGSDIALDVRFPPYEESDLVVRVLEKAHQGLMASPDLMVGRKTPLVPADLNELPTLSWGTPQDGHIWRLQGPGGSTAVVHHKPRLITSDIASLSSAALRGVGVALLPCKIAHENLMRGALMNILPGWAPQAGIVCAMFSSRRGMLPSVRALIDFLVEEFRVQDRAFAQILPSEG